MKPNFMPLNTIVAARTWNWIRRGLGLPKMGRWGVHPSPAEPYGLVELDWAQLTFSLFLGSKGESPGGIYKWMGSLDGL